jgi:hypothetical protein
MKTVRLSVLVCFALLFAACSLKPTWDLVGKWQHDQGKGSIEFFRNGTLTLQNGGTTLTTSYKMKDPKHLQVEMGSLGTLVLKLTVNRDSLTLTDPEGKVSKFQKVK